tara:strand:+ start:231 stop:575 length:345 start_codon:yes stop_codon:yes gene_type:complete
MSSFDKNKSHLSDLEKVNFENDTSLASPVSSIPGVGNKVTEHLKKQKIENIDDLLKSICNDFDKLVQITPSRGVNNHKIFDAIECYRQAKPKITDNHSALPEILKAQEKGCSLQ